LPFDAVRVEQGNQTRVLRLECRQPLGVGHRIEPRCWGMACGV
jgi:hypothetical protein